MKYSLFYQIIVSNLIPTHVIIIFVITDTNVVIFIILEFIRCLMNFILNFIESPIKFQGVNKLFQLKNMYHFINVMIIKIIIIFIILWMYWDLKNLVSVQNQFQIIFIQMRMNLLKMMNFEDKPLNFFEPTQIQN